MKPRASMPTTLSTTTSPSASRPALARASTTRVKATWSSRIGVMSLNVTPGLGKSAMSRTRDAMRSLRPSASLTVINGSLVALGARLAGRLGASGRASAAERLLRRGHHPSGAGGLGTSRRPGRSLGRLVDLGMDDVVLVVHRHPLGERRHVGVAVDLPTGSRLGTGVLL